MTFKEENGSLSAVDTTQAEVQQTKEDQERFKIAIIGGGPGGLFAAWHLAAKAGLSCDITIFEADNRLGGKIQTGEFAGVGPYEAGVAEIYDYSRLGPDPLHDLIVNELGLKVKYIRGGPCVIDGKVIQEPEDLAEAFGSRTRDEALSFRQRCSDLLSPEAFYFSIGKDDNRHPWAQVNGEALLEKEFTDDVARRYIRTMAHSDVAAPPHQTNGLNFLKNVLMDVDGYMDIFSVVGGNEQIVVKLADELDADIRLNANVTAVEPRPDGRYRIDLVASGERETAIADYVVIALPLTALSTIHWRSEALEIAMGKHIGYFDRPGHYLRATLLFERPFWRDKISTEWWMLDAFDGCCVYDESARQEYNGYGILAFLIAGNAALALANVSDQRIEELCCEALPSDFGNAKALLLDRRIHRWMASVNAIPGGVPVRPRRMNHRPDPVRVPSLVMVGDYLFDATLNGVLDSADAATDIVVADLLRRRRERRRASGAGGQSGESLEAALDHVQQLIAVESVQDVLSEAWGLGRDARILHLGSGPGRLVSALTALGFDATGAEFDPAIWRSIPDDERERNLLCCFDRLPFEDRAFDVVIETGLCRLPPEIVDKAVAEVRRVARKGLIVASVTTDLSIDLIERFDLLEGVRVLCSRWDWSERLYASGFRHALFDPARLEAAWKAVEAEGEGPLQWYGDAESLLFSVYELTPAKAQVPESGNAMPVAVKVAEPELVAAK